MESRHTDLISELEKIKTKQLENKTLNEAELQDVNIVLNTLIYIATNIDDLKLRTDLTGTLLPSDSAPNPEERFALIHLEETYLRAKEIVDNLEKEEKITPQEKIAKIQKVLGEIYIEATCQLFVVAIKALEEHQEMLAKKGVNKNNFIKEFWALPPLQLDGRPGGCIDARTRGRCDFALTITQSPKLLDFCARALKDNLNKSYFEVYAFLLQNYWGTCFRADPRLVTEDEKAICVRDGIFTANSYVFYLVRHVLKMLELNPIESEEKNPIQNSVLQFLKGSNQLDSEFYNNYIKFFFSHETSIVQKMLQYLLENIDDLAQQSRALSLMTTLFLRIDKKLQRKRDLETWQDLYNRYQAWLKNRYPDALSHHIILNLLIKDNAWNLFIKMVEFGLQILEKDPPILRPLEEQPLGLLMTNEQWAVLEKVIDLQQTLDDPIYCHVLYVATKNGQWQITKKLLIRNVSFFYENDLYLIAVCAIKANQVPQSRDAKSEGDKTVIELLVDRGLNKNHVTPEGTLLHVAARNITTLSTMQWFVTTENILAEDKKGNTPIMLAAATGQIEKVIELYKRDRHFTQKNKYGKTALTLAAEAGHPEVVRFYVDIYQLPDRFISEDSKDPLFQKCLHHFNKSPDENTKMLWLGIAKSIINKCFHLPEFFTHKDGNGQTIMHAAAIHQAWELVEQLLLMKPEGNQYDQAMILAAQSDRWDLVHTFLENGIQPAAWNESGTSVMHIAVLRHQFKFALDLMHKYHCPININGLPYFKTPLHDAAENENSDVVQWLLEQKALVETPCISGNSPLLIAANYGRVENLKILKNHQADLNWRNFANDSAIILAAKAGHLDCVDALLELGAPQEHLLETLRLYSKVDTKIIAHLILKITQPELIKIFLTDKFFRNLLLTLTKNGYWECFIPMLEFQKEHKMASVDFSEFLPYALKANQTAIAFKIIATHPKKQIHVEGKNAFHYAVLTDQVMAQEEKDSHPLGLRLLELKYDLNEVDHSHQDGESQLRTALHFAASTKAVSADTLQWLINNGSGIDDVDKNLDTPLILAIRYREFEKAKILIEAKSNLNLRNEAGEYALSLAARDTEPKMIPIIELLLKNGAHVDVLRIPNYHNENVFDFLAENQHWENFLILFKLAVKKTSPDFLFYLFLTQDDARGKHNPLELMLNERTNAALTCLFAILTELGEIDISQNSHFFGVVLVYAGFCKQWELVKKLKSAALFFNLPHPTGIQSSILHLLVLANQSEIFAIFADELVKNPVNVNSINCALEPTLDTPLGVACSNNHVEIKMVQQLLKCQGIDVNQANSLGNTPLHLTVIHGETQKLKLLLENKECDLIAKNNNDQDVWTLAQEKPEILAIFKESDIQLRLMAAYLHAKNFKMVATILFSMFSINPDKFYSLLDDFMIPEIMHHLQYLAVKTDQFNLFQRLLKLCKPSQHVTVLHCAFDTYDFDIDTTKLILQNRDFQELIKNQKNVATHLVAYLRNKSEITDVTFFEVIQELFKIPSLQSELHEDFTKRNDYVSVLKLNPSEFINCNRTQRLLTLTKTYHLIWCFAKDNTEFCIHFNFYQIKQLLLDAKNLSCALTLLKVQITDQEIQFLNFMLEVMKDIITSTQKINDAKGDAKPEIDKTYPIFNIQWYSSIYRLLKHCQGFNVNTLKEKIYNDMCRHLKSMNDKQQRIELITSVKKSLIFKLQGPRSLLWTDLFRPRFEELLTKEQHPVEENPILRVST